QDTAVGATGQRDGFAHGDFTLDAAGARFLNNVVVKVGIAARLAVGVEIEQSGTNSLEGCQLKSHCERIAQRRKLLAVGAPTEDGLVIVKVALNPKPKVPGRIG